MLTLKDIAEIIYLTFVWKYPERTYLTPPEYNLKAHYTELCDALRLEAPESELCETAEGRELRAYMRKLCSLVEDHNHIVNKYHGKGKQLFVPRW